MFLRFPFNSDRKRITTGINYRHRKVLFLTGGSEIVLSACDKMYSSAPHAKGIVPLDRTAVDEELASLTRRGLRVVAMGVKDIEREPSADELASKDKFGVRDIERSGFTLLLLAGIQDLLRP